MSFEILYHTVHLSDKTKEITNPFTNETVVVPDGEEATRSECDAILELLRSFGCSDPDEVGCFCPEFSDGSRIEVYFDGVEDADHFCGGSIDTVTLSPEIIGFLFELAQVGNFVIQPIMENGGEFVTSQENKNLVQSRWPDVSVIRNAEDLHMVITGGFNAWSEHRSRALGD